jgi:hypothetical protein
MEEDPLWGKKREERREESPKKAEAEEKQPKKWAVEAGGCQPAVDTAENVSAGVSGEAALSGAKPKGFSVEQGKAILRGAKPKRASTAAEEVVVVNEEIGSDDSAVAEAGIRQDNPLMQAWSMMFMAVKSAQRVRLGVVNNHDGITETNSLRTLHSHEHHAPRLHQRIILPNSSLGHS